MRTHEIKSISIRNSMGIVTLTPAEMGVTYAPCPKEMFNNLFTAPEGCCFIKVLDGKLVIPKTKIKTPEYWESQENSLELPEGIEMTLFYDGQTKKADFDHVCQYYIVNIAQLEQMLGDAFALIYAERTKQYDELMEFERKQQEYWKSTAAAAKSAMDDYFKNR
jgi:hypothetical protein